MCLVKYKDETEYSEPVRVRKVKWARSYPPSPPRTAYYSNTRVVEERQPLPPSPQTIYESRTEIKRSGPPSPPSAHSSHAVTDAKSVSGTTTVPPASFTTRSHFVEVEHDSDSSVSNASSDDVRSRTTHKTHKTSKTSTTRRSSKSRTPAPPPVSPPGSPPTSRSDYSVHEREKEIRRERTYSRPRDDYDTYQYVNAPTRQSLNGRGYYDPRASYGSHGRDSQQYYR